MARLNKDDKAAVSKKTNEKKEKVPNGVVPRKRGAAVIADDGKKAAAAAKTIAEKAPAKSRGRKAAAVTATPEPAKESTPAEVSESRDMDVDGNKDNADSEVEETEERPAKKVKVEKAEKKEYIAPVPKARKFKVVRERSTKKLDVFVFGKGDMCELGLGPTAKARTVTRPRLNPFLPIDSTGVVEVAVGGMHTAVLTHDGKILTWGVNDQNALGRNTAWEAPEVDIDKAGSDSDSEASEEGQINPLESTPGPVEGLSSEVNIVNIACSDSLTLAMTDTGYVYAWGTFRCSDGILGFSEEERIATHPVLLPNLKNIIDIATGVDHILALTSTGTVFAWGNGQQYQLGRRVIERTRMNGLVPREFGLKKIKTVGAGSYHSFAVDTNGKVWAWGLNQYGQCGIELGGQTGEDSVAIPKPTLVKSLSKYNIVQITGGEHHSAAVTDDGKLLTWGRLDANQLGIDVEELKKSEFTVFDEHGKPRFITEPTIVPDLPPIAKVACGTHHNIAIGQDGRAYSWGFGENYQVGQGPAGEDVLVPTLIDNTATRAESLVFAGCGGQFSVMAGFKKEADSVVLNGKDIQVNGTS